MDAVTKIDGMPELREDIREHMYDCLPPWLYYRNAPGGRDWWCMRCGASDLIRPGKMRTETPEMRSVMDARHKGTARCPACGRSAEAKLADAQKKQDAAVRAAKKDEADKVKKKLEAINEKLKKAEESAAEQKKQISMLQDQIRAAEAEEASAEREPEESPELLALREEKEKLEKKLLAADPTMARFGVLIGQYQAQFAQLLQMAQDAENRDMHKKMMDVLTRVQASFTAALAEE